MKIATLSAFAQAYITCALWSSTDDDGEPLDSAHSVDDIAPETLARMVEDCEQFQADNAALLDEAALGWSDEKAGHDFWLTRNGHGAGFWDRACSKEDRESGGAIAKWGDALTLSAKAFGSFDLYIGDDGQIYGS